MLLDYLKYLTLFIMVSSSVGILSLIVSFFMSVFSNPPKMFVLTDKERIFYGLLISYFFTYIIAYLI
jgi:hypothetical protein